MVRYGIIYRCHLSYETRLPNQHKRSGRLSQQGQEGLGPDENLQTEMNIKTCASNQ